MTNRALLLAGGLVPAYNHQRYGHELWWWAECLERNGFQCRVCLGDGKTSLRPSPTIRVTSAVRNDVNAAVSWLSGMPEDALGLIVVSNHGDRSGICLWGPDILTPTELRQMIEPVKSRMVLIMGQCFGGVFGSLADTQTVVLSACSKDEKSWACPNPPGIIYDEFLYQLGTALFGAPADAPQPGPARRPLSLLDSFHWAKAQDRCHQETPMIFDPGGITGEIYF